MQSVNTNVPGCGGGGEVCVCVCVCGGGGGGGTKYFLDTPLILSGAMYLGPVVQSIASLTSLLMTNSLNVVAKIFSNTLIFLWQNCE